MQSLDRERIGILIVAAAIVGGIFLFKEALYLIPLTTLLITIMLVYAFISSRKGRNNSSKNSNKVNEASPKKNVQK